jgi:hypothetical protein
MKKLFALLMVAGTFAMYSCGGGHKEEGAADSTATSAEATPMDTATATMDTTAVDTSAAAPAADTTAHAAH